MLALLSLATAADYYTDDFESGAGSEWSQSSLNTENTTDLTTFSGRFNADTQTLSQTLDAGDYCLEFDLLLIDSWDGNSSYGGPDVLTITADGTEIFSDWLTGDCWDYGVYNGYCSYQGFDSDYARDAFGGSSSWEDTVYYDVDLPFSVAATGATTISWADSGLQSYDDESWGIDEVRIHDDDTDGDGILDCEDLEDCDNLDNDGDSRVDEDTDDTDGDGLCDDLDEEECGDGVDNDGDGQVDEAGAVDAGTWFEDADGDGYGDAASPVTDCVQPSSTVEDDTDCDDDATDVNPAAEEVWYDGVDQDCDGGSDYDQDGDGVDSAEHGGEDCDDTDPDTYPGAPEIDADGIDQDCNGVDSGVDTDQDGLSDDDEVEIYGTDPDLADTDEDGLSDGEEVNEHGTDPLLPDTDEDGLGDGEEVNEYGTEPLIPDTDEDGLSDGEEVNEYGTDPLLEDTDEGGVPDGEEVERGSDPLDASDDFPDTGIESDELKGGGGCGCATTSPAGGAALLLLGLLVLRRRKGGPPFDG